MDLSLVVILEARSCLVSGPFPMLGSGFSYAALLSVKGSTSQ